MFGTCCSGAGRITWSRALVLAVSAAFVLGGAGCRQEAAEAPAETARNVRVLALAPETLTEYFEITGPVAPVRGTDVSAQESGPVTALPAVKGDTVVAGQALVDLERDILAAEMEAAAAALRTEDYNLDKVRRLHEAQKVSRMELLAAETAFHAAKSQADISRERFERARIKAPFAGVVADRYVELGQMVLPGQPVVRVIDPFILKLEGYLTDDQVAWARPGVAAEVALGDAGISAAGEVSWVGLEADLRTGKFKVEIEIPNPDLTLRSGVIGRARLPKNTSHQVVTVPRDAVLDGRHGPQAFIVKDLRAQLVSLVLGAFQGGMVVVEAGLHPGDLLVVRGQRDLVDGSLVEITERATSPDGTLATDPAVVSTANTGAAR